MNSNKIRRISRLIQWSTAGEISCNDFEEFNMSDNMSYKFVVYT